MEQGMTRYPSHRGFMLVTVLIITAVGLLFGAGALLLFRYQCQLRIDRQHELEKVYAVRSALNYVKTYSRTIDESGLSLRFHTTSDRDLKLVVKPVADIFPIITNEHHLVMWNDGSNRGFSTQNARNQRSCYPDYEYGALGTDNDADLSTTMSGYDSLQNKRGFVVNDTNAVMGAKWWVNIGMYETGGWIESDYGRRYRFEPYSYVDGNAAEANAIKDIMRLCIIRNVTNKCDVMGQPLKDGCKLGWPLSQLGEKALVFQIKPKAGSQEKSTKVSLDNAEMTLWEYEYGKNPIRLGVLSNNVPSMCAMGLQMAGRKVSLFYISNDSQETGNDKPITVLDTKEMDERYYRYFSESVEIGGESYGGIWTNSDGRVKAPELRAVFEIEAASNARKRNANDNPLDSNRGQDVLMNFRVTPAYQYDIFLEHPIGSEPKRATVAQKTGRLSKKDGIFPFVLTYDTHGTENKGFRKDEKDWAAKRGGGE